MRQGGSLLLAEVGTGVLAFELPSLFFLDFLHCSLLRAAEGTLASPGGDDIPASNPDVKSPMSKPSNWSSPRGLDDTITDATSVVSGSSAYACAWGNPKGPRHAFFSDVMLVLSSSEEFVHCAIELSVENADETGDKGDSDRVEEFCRKSKSSRVFVASSSAILVVVCAVICVIIISSQTDSLVIRTPVVPRPDITALVDLA